MATWTASTAREYAARIVAALAVVLIAACATPERPEFSPIAFDREPPIRLDVDEIEVVDRRPDQPPENAIGDRFQTPPWEAARIWAYDRLQAERTSRRKAVFAIERAEAVETAVPTRGGIRGAFTDEQSRRYTVTIGVRLSIVSPQGDRLGFAAGSAERSTTAPQSLTYNQRRQLWHRLTRETMQALAAELEPEIRETLGDFVIRR